MKAVGVLISGRGTNLQALIDAQAALSAYRIDRVISNVEGVYGLERARAADIEALTIPYKGKPRETFERELNAALQGCEIIALAGFMRVLTPYFVNAWAGKILNIHPSLLPSFPGRDTHARALEAGVKVHGCTVHVVTEALDDGPIVGQAAIPVQPDDTPETLAERLLEAEHLLYPRALAAFAGAGPTSMVSPLLSAWRR